MQKFTKIFAVLAQAEMNDELERALRKVSQMLNIDYDKIRIYFEQHSVPKRPDLMRADFTPPNVIATIEKAIAGIKSKSKGIKVLAVILCNRYKRLHCIYLNLTNSSMKIIKDNCSSQSNFLNLYHQ